MKIYIKMKMYNIYLFEYKFFIFKKDYNNTIIITQYWLSNNSRIYK